MSNERLKELRFTKRAKWGIGAVALAGVLSFGIISIANNIEEDEIVNNEQVVAPDNNNKDENKDPVIVVEDEKLAKPFIVNANIKTYYFDPSDNSDTQENALIYYNGMYTPSMAIDYFYNNNSFEVVSCFSGEVIEKKVDPLYGARVYIRSNDNKNLVAVYSSLSDISVNVGDRVEQGKVIAKAGNNTINSSMGNHLNFALLKDNKTIDPIDYYSKVVKNI